MNGISEHAGDMRPALKRHSSRHRHVPPLVLVVGVGLSFLTTHFFHLWQTDTTRFAFESAARERLMAIQRGVESCIQTGRSVTGLFRSSENVTSEEFARFTRAILRDNPYITAVEWAPRIHDPDHDGHGTGRAPGYRDYPMADLYRDGGPVPAERGEARFPIRYVAPMQGNESWLGLDLATVGVHRGGAEDAGLTQESMSVPRTVLFERTQDGWRALMYLPVSPGRGDVGGLVALLIDVPLLVRTSIDFLNPTGVRFTIHDSAGGSPGTVLYRHGLAPQQGDGLLSDESGSDAGVFFEQAVQVNDSEWTIRFQPDGDAYPTGVSAADLAIFACGAVFSLMLFLYLRLAQRRERDLLRNKRRLEELVSSRTRDLEETNRELEAYSYSIAHDLRSPLRAIMGYSQILSEEAVRKLNDEERDSLRRIVTASEYMGHLIDDILQLARIGRVEITRREVNLSAIALDICRGMEHADAGGAGARFDIEPGLVVKGDPELLTRLLDNLLANAVKFSADREEPRISFGSAVRNGETCYYVRDNGVGFDMAFVDKMFGAFQRLHHQSEYPGTGIGLATVRRIVERHGGRVWAEGRENEGATFYFTLPHD